MADIQPLACLKDVHRLKRGICDSCDATVFFEMITPTGSHHVDLKTILDCLYWAQIEGHLTPIDEYWWNRVWNRYGAPLQNRNTIIQNARGV